MLFKLKKTGFLLLALTFGMLQTAHAGGLYVYVDEQGIPHYALQKVDERYQLFANNGPVLSDDVVFAAEQNMTNGQMQTNLPNMGSGAYASNIDAVEMANANIANARKHLKLPKGGQMFGRMVTPSGLNIPPPSRSVLNRLLNSSNMARYEPTVIRHSRVHHVDYNLVKAVMAAESGFNSSAISNKNAMGLMQVIPPTAARYGVTAAQLMQPERNIYAGVRYLADLSRMFKGRPELIIAAYNAGEGAVYKYHHQIPPYRETQNYVRTVLQFYNVYAPRGGFGASNSMFASSDSVQVMKGKGSRRGMQRVKVSLSGGTLTPEAKRRVAFSANPLGMTSRRSMQRVKANIAGGFPEVKVQ